jgi:hypothetical protein
LLFYKVAEIARGSEIMSAQRDYSQKIAFYFGNAAKDLGHLLPQENPADLPIPQAVTPSPFAELNNLLDSIQSKSTAIMQHQRHLSFLIQELKRSLK